MALIEFAESEPVDQFEVTVLYKSGNKMSFWCTEFTFSFKGASVNWVPADGRLAPMFIGVDDIEAVWQTGHRVAPIIGAAE